MRVHWVFVPILFVFLVVLVAASDGVWVARFSSADREGGLKHWKDWAFARVDRKTRYQLSDDQGYTVLRAESDDSASALVKRLRLDPQQYPVLSWEWKTDGPLSQFDWGIKETDDYPLRVFVLFDDVGVFGFFRKLGGRFTGEAVNYVWTPAQLPDGLAAASPVTGRVQMVVAESGSCNLGRWVREEHNVLADYRRLFGKEPGSIIAVALMTDTDNTASRCVSFFGDIRFKSLQ